MLLLVIFRMENRYACHHLANPQESEANDKPCDTEYQRDNRVSLCAAASRNREVEHTDEHKHIQSGAQARGQDSAEDTAFLDSGKCDDTDHAGYAIQQECAKDRKSTRLNSSHSQISYA